ncbi:MAG TPA: 2Fe-2S iron-sulfur cluster-binding protein [Nitrososphaerales archaeon]|nr:2Fe-2S iron-sulfur cluster-binding protein [Nitrososphaerales archaeon]
MKGRKEGNEVILRVSRGHATDSSKDRYETFVVPYQEGMVVLNAIHYIQSHFDSSLAARWNCKAGRCGSRFAEINGWPRLMCKTPVAE